MLLAVVVPGTVPAVAAPTAEVDAAKPLDRPELPENRVEDENGLTGTAFGLPEMLENSPGDDVTDDVIGLENALVGVALFAVDPKLKMPLAELIGDGPPSGFVNPSTGSFVLGLSVSAGPSALAALVSALVTAKVVRICD